MNLSKRLKAVADLVSPGAKVADIGCDHGYVSIYLMQQKAAEKVIALDVKKGPLERAEVHMKEAGLSSVIETRLSDGAAALQAGEADTAVIAGMGGKLMVRILSESERRLGKWKELVLQPQSQIAKVREYLWQSGYEIIKEDIVFEVGKYYQMMKAVSLTENIVKLSKKGRIPIEQSVSKMAADGEASVTEPAYEAFAEYGYYLLMQAHPVMVEYLHRKMQNYLQIKEHILQQNSSLRAGNRIKEIEHKLLVMQTALDVGGKKMAMVTIHGKISMEETGLIQKEYEIGTTYEEIVKEFQEFYDYQIALVVIDGKVQELFKKLKKDCTLSFLTLRDNLGHKTYVRSATMLFMKAIHDVTGPDEIEKVKVEFAIGKGYYCSLKGRIQADSALTQKIAERMHQLVAQDIRIIKHAYPRREAVALFSRQRMYDKEKLFRYRRGSTVNVYEMDGYFDYYYGYMLPSTGYIKRFSLQQHEEGFVLNLPERQDPTHIEVFEPRKKLFETMCQATKWGNMLGLDTVGDLNDQICAGNLSDLVLVQEALQERRIGEIAQEISKREGVKFVMIAGPSSSGKTTFSHRLSIQLRTYGLVPHPIALDDYFKNREDTPRDENGDYNFECLEALDVEQFNKDMCRLLAGEEVELPTFNFKTGLREYKGKIKKLGKDDILVIEGIHGLNDKMSYSLPNNSKYKIYISALTSLNIDEHNRIPTTDGRLLRRMVRDARTRGSSAKRTIQMWPSVRRGEEENIFPFQEGADAFFNSALIYELAVLKQFAEPLLFEITPEDKEYYEAKRLLKFLEYFLGVSSENLPNNSIVREFVGGSCFPV